jgi:predicted nucleic acid-binding protein
MDRVDLDAILSSRHVTDTYLLALAVKHGGRLATFDKRLKPDAVKSGADALHIIATV